MGPLPSHIDTHDAHPSPTRSIVQRYTFPSESRLKEDLMLARKVYARLLECVVAHGTTTGASMPALL